MRAVELQHAKHGHGGGIRDVDFGHVRDRGVALVVVVVPGDAAPCRPRSEAVCSSRPRARSRRGDRLSRLRRRRSEAPCPGRGRASSPRASRCRARRCPISCVFVPVSLGPRVPRVSVWGTAARTALSSAAPADDKNITSVVIPYGYALYAQRCSRAYSESSSQESNGSSADAAASSGLPRPPEPPTTPVASAAPAMPPTARMDRTRRF